MPDQSVRLCLIGAGAHSSRNVLPNLHLLEGAQVLALAEIDADRARRAAGAFAIPAVYSDYAEMVESERPDGVIVCVGPEFHARVAPELMRLGCHVYVEKPPALSLEEARGMRAASRVTGRSCMVAFKKRFAPAYVRAKAIIDGEEFGQPLVLNLLRTTGNDRLDEGEWLYHQECHAIDLAHFLFGPVARVSAVRTAQQTAFSANSEFASGAIGNLSCNNKGGCWEEVTAFGTSFVRVDIRNSVRMTARKRERPIDGYEPSWIHGANRGCIEQGFLPELQEFVDAIREDREPGSSIEHSVHMLAIYEAIVRSTESGRPEDVEEA